jgi:hypothetical protein
MATDSNANEWSVPCSIDGCHATVVHDTRCAEHGGHPAIEWAESDFGEVTYTVNTEVSNRQPESEQIGGADA